MENYEQKYKEALEKTKKLDKDGCHVLRDVFPELEESDDEKIRKDLIEFVNQYGDKFYGTIAKASAISWLEKQKSSDEALQYLKENHSPSEISDFQAAMNIAVAKAFDAEKKQGEPKYLEPDSSVVETVKQNIEECKKSMKAPISLKKGDFIVSDLNSIGIVNYQRHGSDIDCFVIMRNNKNLMIKTCPEYICNMYFSRFATEEEKQKLLTAMEENGYIWDFDKLELRKKEHKFQPFEKVLVRDYEEEEWGIDIFSNKTDNGQFQCIGNMWRQCVPYEGNERMLGKTENI